MSKLAFVLLLTALPVAASVSGFCAAELEGGKALLAQLEGQRVPAKDEWVRIWLDANSKYPQSVIEVGMLQMWQEIGRGGVRELIEFSRSELSKDQLLLGVVGMDEIHSKYGLTPKAFSCEVGDNLIQMKILRLRLLWENFTAAFFKLLTYCRKPTSTAGASAKTIHCVALVNHLSDLVLEFARSQEGSKLVARIRSNLYGFEDSESKREVRMRDRQLFLSALGHFLQEKASQRLEQPHAALLVSLWGDLNFLGLQFLTSPPRDCAGLVSY